MKKLLALFFVLVSIALFVSCGNEVNKADSDGDTSAQTDNAQTDNTQTDGIATDNAVTDSAATDGIANDEKADGIQADTETPDADSGSVEKEGPVTLLVYSNGWGNLLDTLTMDNEGDIKIEVKEDNPYDGKTPSYFIYAKRKNAYTQIYFCKFGETIKVNLDTIVKDKFNGVIFVRQNYFGPEYMANTQVTMTQGVVKAADFKTDSMGRFAIDIPAGEYKMAFDFASQSSPSAHYNETVQVAGNYQDYDIPAQMQAAKPNIYLYPTEEITLDVVIDFPKGGYVSESIPEYGEGWHVTVTPDGMIDGQYEYLFYESIQPEHYQNARGWVVEASKLNDFFNKNLAQTGFEGREITDFTDYWIPRLNYSPYFVIYPQYADTVDESIKLGFSIVPESILRLIYVVKGVESAEIAIEEPLIPDFERSGFTAVEWGVIRIGE